jgi:hypothetical protein
MEKKKYLPPPEIKPGSSISQLVVGYFTDWGILSTDSHINSL